MRCGSKCFVVEMEIKGQKQMKWVNARTPADARKAVRLEFGAETAILKVIKEK